jgi:hypothetical protein
LSKKPMVLYPLFDIFKETLHFCAEKTGNSVPYSTFCDNRQAFAGVCVWRKNGARRPYKTAKVGLCIKNSISFKNPPHWAAVIKFIALHEFGHLICRHFVRRKKITTLQAEIEAERFALAMARRFYPDAYAESLKMAPKRFKWALERQDIMYAALSLAFPEYRRKVVKTLRGGTLKAYYRFMRKLKREGLVKRGILNG